MWQTHRSRSEEWLFDERGDELPIFETPVGNIGVIVGRDAYYPETARMLALRGADVILSPQATAGPFNPWRQLSGVWKDAQQNQVFAVEAHVQGTMWGRSFEGRAAILAPCEITPDGSGFLSESGDAFLQSAHSASALSGSGYSDSASSESGHPEFGPLESVHAASGHSGSGPLESDHSASADSGSEALMREAQVNLNERSRAQAIFPVFSHLNPALYRNQPWWKTPETPEGPGGERS